MDTQTRHALKQDRLIEATKTSVDWFQENRSRVIQAGVALLVLIAIVVAALVIYSKRSAAADLAFGEAMDTYNAPLAQAGQPAPPGEKTFRLPLHEPRQPTSSSCSWPISTTLLPPARWLSTLPA